MPTAGENRALLQRYFDLMSAGDDFSACYAEDVVWTDCATGEEFRGRAAVREHVLDLHGGAYVERPRGLSLDVTDERAHLEGEFTGGEGPAVPFCLAFDLAAAPGGVLVAALRLYLSADRLTPARTST
ncbi:nuclear transport factor 2 family protein [Kineococcus sp. SYSU DK004]|uniref:nuclear transport factor 2 family protein n=1 Tax=Kineococcus sp. SYSU DK004 TaxID=3383125 RepID=UPI003D7D152B